MHENIEHLRGKIILHEADITSAERIFGIFEKIRPKAVFHLAAESFVPTSFREPVRVSLNNIVGTIKIFEAARRFDDDLESVHVACSSEQYGLVDPKEVPVIEDLKSNPFRPRSIYGISKVATEQIAWLYHNSYNVPSVITRAFNHEGPRRGIQFVTSVIHRQIVEILEGKRNSIIIGNPNSIRDFTHVKDTINAYILVSEQKKYGEPYNVCSGKGISIADYVKLAKKIYDISADVYVDPKRMRPSEVSFSPFKNLYYIIKSEIIKRITLEFPPYNIDIHNNLISTSWDPIRYGTIALAINTIKNEKIKGHFAELGVFRGETSKIIHLLAPEKKLYLFDTFEGFPIEFLENKAELNRFKNTQLEAVKKRIGNLNNIIIRKGIFPETTKGLESETFSFVYLDADLYKSTLEGLKFFYPKISKGRYLLIHDYHNPKESNAGVLRAVKEFMIDKKEKILEIPDILGSIIIRKI